REDVKLQSRQHSERGIGTPAEGLNRVWTWHVLFHGGLSPTQRPYDRAERPAWCAPLTLHSTLCVSHTPAVAGRTRETLTGGTTSCSTAPCPHERAGAVEPVPWMWYDPLRRQGQPWAQAHSPPRGPVERSRAMAFLPSMPDADMKDTLAREPAIGIPFSQLNEAVMRG